MEYAVPNLAASIDVAVGADADIIGLAPFQCTDPALGAIRVEPDVQKPQVTTGNTGPR
jgi:hypothetical protein